MARVLLAISGSVAVAGGLLLLLIDPALPAGAAPGRIIVVPGGAVPSPVAAMYPVPPASPHPVAASAPVPPAAVPAWGPPGIWATPAEFAAPE